MDGFILVALGSQKKGAQEGKWLDPSTISKADSFKKGRVSRDSRVWREGRVGTGLGVDSRRK